ncbi:MAG TPA: SusC/RagA family TonB-linked outer membrane protein [Longimicrobiaceae bacterium]|nr:SusC/RagA family TonB-linked outer membrane protein [Longimicrobiaceae bacterium]
MSKIRWLIALVALAATPAALHAQATGSVQGTVVDAATLAPIASAQVFVSGGQGSLTDASGRYNIVGVPAGSHTLQVEVIGYEGQSQTINVTAGSATTVNFELVSGAIALQEVVVTGLSGATIKAKVPFDIATVTAEDIQVPSTSAAGAIQGKIAGATVISGSGRPGAPPTILLRAPTAINASGRSQEPLYIVDGVILGSSMIDIGSTDIASIEVIKGAAASSLYGSRAANGVVQITTKRGASIPDDEVRYTVRSEYGKSQMEGDFLLTQSHEWALNEAGTKFLDSTTGTECDFLDFGEVDGCNVIAIAGQRAAPGEPADAWNTYQTQPWPGTTYDQVDRFFTGGDFMTNYVSAQGRSGATNFLVSFSNTNDEGVMIGHDGFKRNSFRVNLDQSVQENLTISASAFYSRSEADPRDGGLFDLTRQKAGVNLAACEGDQSSNCLNNVDNLLLLSDPTNAESPNPLYDMLYMQPVEERGRFLGSINGSYSPVEWIDLAANVSYDRLDEESVDVVRPGYRTVDNSSSDFRGWMDQDFDIEDAINASITSTFSFDLTDAITNRTSLRYLYEAQNGHDIEVEGEEFQVNGVPQWDALDSQFFDVESSETAVRSDGYYIISDFDIADRYIISTLIRNDGSSLFGENERRQWYGRLAGAWRISQEPWFTVPAVDELKLRAAYGTAGGRPRFSAQYETYQVDGSGIVPGILGNEDLKPEFSVEQEYGFDASFMDGRFVSTVTYATTTTEDQILLVPLPSYAGFSDQWRNAGTLESNTWEASLDVRLMQTEDFYWSARLIGDRTRQKITQLDVPAYSEGVGGQGLGDVFYYREGEAIGTFYGVQVAESCANLPVAGQANCDQFAVNDRGVLVWVGDGSLADNAWGEKGNVEGVGAVQWGVPFAGECTDRITGERTSFCPIGKTTPDYNVGLSSSMSWKGVSLYALFDATQGISVYNQPLQWAVFKRTAGTFDQRGVPEAEQKPLGYWDATYGVSGLNPSSIFVEDGSYVKLREMALRYTVSDATLDRLPGISAFSGLTVSLIGRNLKTWTDYRGYDPEVGSSGGGVGSAAIARVDGYGYPNFRTYTVGVELNF